MATDECSALKIDRYPHGDYYSGTREAIIAAGVAKDGMFPGDPGRNRTSVTIKEPQDSSGPHFNILRQSKKRFQVFVPTAPEECEAREESLDGERALGKAKDEAEKEMRAIPADEEMFRERCLSYFLASINMFKGLSSSYAGGYALAPEDQANLDWALSEAERTIESARITFDAKARSRQLIEIRGKVADADASFQGFIATANARAN